MSWGGLIAILGGVAVFVASFLPQAYDLEYLGAGGDALWHRASLLTLFAVCVTGVLAAVAAAVARPDDDHDFLGLRGEHWAAALGTVSFVSAVLSVITWQSGRWGSYVLAIAAAVVFVGTMGSRFIPVLRSPLGGGAGTPAAQPYWVAVPATRTIYRTDSPNSAVGSLPTGEWHLVLGHHGGGLLVRSSQGLQGILFDVHGLIQG
jgi:hypothetical protein